MWDQRGNEDILAETGEVQVEDQLRLKRLKWFGHLKRMPDHRPQLQVLKCCPQGKKRKPGGTSLRWIDIVNRDLSKIANWEQLVRIGTSCDPPFTSSACRPAQPDDKNCVHVCMHACVCVHV